MVKYASDKCGDEIRIGDPRHIIRMQDANHKGSSDRVICLCQTCMEVAEDQIPWLFQIGYAKKEAIR
jgi:hypothetical protein